ncbi:MAG: radical SAM protein, partial [Deltaproteobacteria bacterium]|nr:radical SAM protein [Deltaproteobacteria bacterium]
YEEDPEKAKTELELEEIKEVFEKSSLLKEIKEVNLTGGEPFLHPEIEKVVDAIASRGLVWRANTNGSRLETMAKILSNEHWREAPARLIFSLDGAKEETHDRIRGAGSYREVMQAIALATAFEVPFALQMVIHAENESEIEEFAFLAARLGADRVSFAPYAPTGTHFDKAFYISRRGWDSIVHRIERVAEVLSVPVHLTARAPTPELFRVCDPWRNRSLHVNVNGELSLCCDLAEVPTDPNSELSDVIANLHEVSLFEAHARSLPLIQELMRRRIKAIAEGSLSPWDEVSCNWCSKQFGKPHWKDDGEVGGGVAERPRWRGAWAGGNPGKRPAPKGLRLPVLDE